LKQILRKMERLMTEGRLKLKSDKARKAKRKLKDVLERESLMKLYTQCAQVAARERQILNSPKMEETKRNLSEYQKQTKRLKAIKERFESHESVKERAYKETLDKISHYKRAIEKNVQSSLGEKVQIL
jgi:hypothetical protein